MSATGTDSVQSHSSVGNTDSPICEIHIRIVDVDSTVAGSHPTRKEIDRPELLIDSPVFGIDSPIFGIDSPNSRRHRSFLDIHVLGVGMAND